MSGIDAVREIAEQVLGATTVAGRTSTWLWDRAQRLVRNVEHICRLPEIAQADLPIDRLCLIAAAYLGDSGFVMYADAKGPSVGLAFSDISTSDLLDFSCQVVRDKLAGIMPNPKIEKTNKIIIESGNRHTRMNEAMILSDARSLDDMGAVGILNEFRRYVVHGKGAADAIQSWKRKIDYRYWQVRLTESFRFESVRELAARRFNTAVYFMNQLELENCARDLEEIILDSLDSVSNT